MEDDPAVESEGEQIENDETKVESNESDGEYDPEAVVKKVVQAKIQRKKKTEAAEPTRLSKRIAARKSLAEENKDGESSSISSKIVIRDKKPVQEIQEEFTEEVVEGNEEISENNGENVKSVQEDIKQLDSSPEKSEVDDVGGENAADETPNVEEAVEEEKEATPKNIVEDSEETLAKKAAAKELKKFSSKIPKVNKYRPKPRTPKAKADAMPAVVEEPVVIEPPVYEYDPKNTAAALGTHRPSTLYRKKSSIVDKVTLPEETITPKKISLDETSEKIADAEEIKCVESLGKTDLKSPVSVSKPTSSTPTVTHGATPTTPKSIDGSRKRSIDESKLPPRKNSRIDLINTQSPTKKRSEFQLNELVSGYKMTKMPPLANKNFKFQSQFVTQADLHHKLSRGTVEILNQIAAVHEAFGKEM
uniref:DEK_C domain-containing protein n=1 Tax=Rhabditophanes sp. KR3021 TaxID=114890 RepID=A0AC35TN41_9BILA